MKLNKSASAFSNPKHARSWGKLELLLQELEAHELNPAIDSRIEDLINQLNATFESDKEQIAAARTGLQGLLKQIEKDLKLVVKNHYRTQWLALGIAVFGIPIGVALSISLGGNMSFVGIGIPIGIAVGVGIGASLDNQAKKENRQLNMEL